MARAPWEYLFVPFNWKGLEGGFPDLFHPMWLAALTLLIIQILLYNVRTRQLHRHEPLATLQEWLLWTGMITFGLIIVMALFNWYFIFVLLTLVMGLGAYVWIRFVRFPPLIAAYNAQLRRARFFSQAKYKHPEATIRSRRNRRRR
ncbi:MAG: hypothetical protein H0V12_03725 [Chloroflexi bacterium]|nr:hypothetical protein [Chloroflexota bacterium]